MYTLHYIVTTDATFPVRHQLRAAGCKWDYERKEWYGETRDAADTGAALCGGTVSTVTRDALPPKPKPRGRPFKRGGDTRRRSAANGATGATGASAATLEDDSEDDMEDGEDSDAAPRAVTAPTDAAQQFAALVQAMAAGAVDAATVRDIVRAELEDAAPMSRADVAEMLASHVAPSQSVTVTLQVGDASATHTIDTAHKALVGVLARVNVGFRNLFLTGPSGSGKTTLARQAAEALGLPFASVSCSAGMSEGTLLGRLLPTGEAGRFEYSPAQFVTMYETGGVFLLDEVDAADPNTLLVLNSATANGHLDIPNRLHAPVATRHARFILLAAGNTWGTGATREYVGRNQLDAAFLSRFSGATFHMDYDTALEAKLVGALAPAGTADAYMSAFYSVRERITAVGMRRMWGTREALAGARLLHERSDNAWALGQLMLGWTADERSRAGV